MTTGWTDAPGRAYNKYKNKKKSLRKRLNAGNLSQERYDILRQAAEQQYLIDKTLGVQSSKLEQQKAAEEWLAAGNELPSKLVDGLQMVDFGTPGSGDCDGTCIAAESERSCKCICEGVNHGRAKGMHPGAVSVPGLTKEDRVILGLLSEEDYDDWQRILKEKREEAKDYIGNG